MRKRGGKKAAIRVPKDAKSFQFRTRASSEVLVESAPSNFDSHTLPPYLSLPEPLGTCTREHTGTLSPAGCARRQQKPNQLAVRRSQSFRYSPGIDVHRRADVRMTKQFLLHLDICAVLVEQTRICVPAMSPET